MVPPAGFEPAISTLKGWRPWPLDDGDSGKEYSRLFYPFTYRWQIEKPPHRSGFLFRFSNISICNIWAGKSPLSVIDRDKLPWLVKTTTKVPVPFAVVGVLGEELHGGVVSGVLVGVVEGLERQHGCGLRIAAALEGVGNEPVGELGVLGQRRSV